MFYVIAYLTIAVVLGLATTMLYKVTYPGCTSRHCTNHNH